MEILLAHDQKHSKVCPLHDMLIQLFISILPLVPFKVVSHVLDNLFKRVFESNHLQVRHQELLNIVIAAIVHVRLSLDNI